MKRIYLSLIFCLLALFFSDIAAAKVTATIDRNQMALDETVNLSISREGGMSFSSPDLSPLEQDFRIVGRSQSSNTQIINGSVSSSTTLELTLAPKRSGILEIPPLSIGGEQTQVLQVKVVTQAQPKTKADNQPIFIETELDKDTLPVQGQLLFTLRIYWAVEASISEPADPRIKNVLLEKLDDATFNKNIDDVNYKVFERKYAVFPQESGMLNIPQIVVEATVPIRQQRNNFYDFFGTRGRQVKLRSEPKTVLVKEKAANYPAGKIWLPTEKLSIAEDWSEKTDNLQVGESVTLNVAMAGTGLLAAQLPPVELPEIEGLKVYQGKADTQNLKKAEGITGIRRENIALIPVKPGLIELPEIRIPWWNLNENRIEYAVVPARQLHIKKASLESNPSLPPAMEESQSANISRVQEKESQGSSLGSGLNRLLIYLVVFLAAAWLVTLFLLFRARKRFVKDADQKMPNPGNGDALDEKDAFRKFKMACRANDPLGARKALLDWVRISHSEKMLNTVSDLLEKFPGTKMAALIEELDLSIYGRSDQAYEWQGSILLEELEKIRNEIRGIRKGKSAAKRSLTPLYK